MRIAVTGSQGQVARSLLERGPLRGVKVVTLARPQFDLAEPSSVIPAIESIAADIVVNAAAYTAVDRAEAEEAFATQINAAGAGAVALAASRIDAPVIQLSTDYVFDGNLDRPYREDDPTGPLGAYGRSKLLGERAVEAANPRHVILRTSWVYSPFGANFARTMLRLGETHENVNVVTDQTGAPTSALDIADAILDICRALKTNQGDKRLFGNLKDFQPLSRRSMSACSYAGPKIGPLHRVAAGRDVPSATFAMVKGGERAARFFFDLLAYVIAARIDAAPPFSAPFGKPSDKIIDLTPDAMISGKVRGYAKNHPNTS